MKKETFMGQSKPDLIIGEEKDAFCVIELALKKLREEGMSEQALELITRYHSNMGYNKTLKLVGEYVNIVR